LWKVPPIFHRIAYGIKNPPELTSAEAGAKDSTRVGEGILRTDESVKKLMFNTYNMGIGFVLALSPANVQKAAAFLEQKGFPAWEIGRVETAKAGSSDLSFV
jgi:phosphoribosylformylglycinamidine cyclo-ligase